MATVQELLNSVSMKTGLSTQASTPEADFLLAAFNDGVREMLQQTHHLVVTTTLAYTAGDPNITLGPDILSILEYRNADENNWAPFEHVQADEILERWPGAASGAPRRYSLVGGNLIRIDPIPTVDGTIEIHAVIAIAEITDTSTTIAELGVRPYVKRAIETWMLMQAAEKNRDFDAIKLYQGEFEKECGKIRKQDRALGGRRLPVAKVGYPGRRTRSAAPNSAYPGNA